MKEKNRNNKNSTNKIHKIIYKKNKIYLNKAKNKNWNNVNQQIKN